MFYATWCGHCNEFKPTWEIIKQWCGAHNIVAKEYENEQVEAMTVNPSKNDSGIPMKMVEGYPSIFIIKKGNIQLVDKRDKDYIIRLLGGELPLRSEIPQEGGKKIVQTGGGKPESGFKMKYLKYKKKYLNSKK
jgi:hypothetical protein